MAWGLDVISWREGFIYFFTLFISLFLYFIYLFLYFTLLYLFIYLLINLFIFLFPLSILFIYFHWPNIKKRSWKLSVLRLLLPTLFIIVFFLIFHYSTQDHPTKVQPVSNIPPCQVRKFEKFEKFEKFPNSEISKKAKKAKRD